MRPFANLRLLAPVAGVLLLAAMAAVWSLAPGAQAGPNCTVSDSLDGEELAFLTQINAYRQQNGVGPLAMSGTLTRAAAWKSQDLVNNNYFAHDDTYVPRSWDQRIRDCGYTYNAWIGENLAAGNSDAANTFEQWKNSPGHNANMLNADFNAIGIARAYGAGATYGWYWTTDFGGYVDAPPAQAPTPTRVRTPTPVLPPGSYPDADGDVDCNGATTAVDASLVLQVSAGTIGTLPCLTASDAHSDGVLNALDALAILQFDAGLLASLPT